MVRKNNNDKHAHVLQNLQRSVPVLSWLVCRVVVEVCELENQLSQNSCSIFLLSLRIQGLLLLYKCKLLSLRLMVSKIKTNSCPWMITQTFKAYLPNWQGSMQVIL